MTLEYVCGCREKDFDGVSDPEFWKKKLFFDAEGFVICKTHLQRRKGWRLPSSHDVRAKHSRTARFGMDALAFEQFELFGVEFKCPKISFEYDPKNDRRDKRDPATMVLER